MLTASFRAVETIGYRHFLVPRNHSFFSRTSSTNSAIARGIRRSRARASTEQHGFASDRTRARNEAETRGGSPQNKWSSSTRRDQNSSEDRPRSGGFSAGRKEIPRRPNHQQRQDVEDIEQSSLREKRRTPRQERYLRGGSREPPFTQHAKSDRYSQFQRPGQDFAGKKTFDKSGSLYGRDQNRFGESRGFDRQLSEGRTQRSNSNLSANRDDSYHKRQNWEQRRADQFGRSKPITNAETGARYTDWGPQRERVSDVPRSSDPERFEERRAARAAKAESEEFTPARGTPSSGEFDKTRDKNAPLSIPYTTPASEFLYGTSVVVAALKSPRRKLYHLYMYNGDHREGQNMDAAVKKLALAHGIKISQVKTDWLPLMDKMSAGRPHNGYILEASPLPKLPATGLRPVTGRNRPLEVTLDHQSREDELINGTDPTIHYKTAFRRYPFILMLDGILDPGNLGAILRTAHFLSVDAVAISARHSAPLTPIALKASAGASESLPLLSIPHPGAFVDESQRAGWKFYAAVAPPSAVPPSSPKSKPVSPDEKPNVYPTGKVPAHYTLAELATRSPLDDAPVVLMLGAEGEGLRWNLQKKADATVSIEGGWRLLGDGAGRVDSLNVSVAAGLLCEGFLRRPVGVGAEVGKGAESKSDGQLGDDGGEAAGRTEPGARVQGDLF